MRKAVEIGVAIALTTTMARAQLMAGFTNTFTVGGADDGSLYSSISTNGTFVVTNLVVDGVLLDADDDGYALIKRDVPGSATVGAERSLGMVGSNDVGRTIVVDAGFRHLAGLTSAWEIMLDGASPGGDAKKQFSSFSSGTILNNVDYLLSAESGVSRGPGALKYSILPGDIGKVATVRFSTFDSSAGGTRQFAVDAVSFHLEEATNLFFYINDDFETGSGTLAYNGWTGSGPEPKEYNGTNFPGMLAVRDLAAEEKGTNSTHNGYWDTISYELEDGISLPDDNDWFQMEMDLGIFQDASGAALPEGRNLRVSFIDVNAPSNAGFGFMLQTSTNSAYENVRTYNAATAYGDLLDGANFVHAFDGSMNKLHMKVTRVAGGYNVNAAWGTTSFNQIMTVSNCLAETFNLLTLTVTTKDVAFKVDNVVLVANVPPTVLPPYEKWMKLINWNGLDANPGADPDSDGLNNWGEYVFGGNPTVGTDIGTQPALMGGGDLIYTLRNDSNLTACVLAKDDLVYGEWTTNAPMGVSVHDGELGIHTNHLGVAGSQQFFKLLVE